MFPCKSRRWYSRARDLCRSNSVKFNFQYWRCNLLVTTVLVRGDNRLARPCEQLLWFTAAAVVAWWSRQSPGHDTITLSEARSRLDRSRFSRPRPHFLAFFKIYKKITFSRANSGNFCQKIGKICKNFDIFWQILQNFAKFSEIRKNSAENSAEFYRNL